MKHTLIANKWRTPDGTLLHSVHVHDFVSHKDANGDDYFVDGGTDYVRMSKNDIPMTNECVYADEDYEKVREVELRGALIKGKGGKTTRCWMPISKMTDAHLCNCIRDNIRYAGELFDLNYNIHTHLYIKELLYRFEKQIIVKDAEYFIAPNGTVIVDYESCPLNPEYIDNLTTFKKENRPTLDMIKVALNDFSAKSDDVIIRMVAMAALTFLDGWFEKMSYAEELEDIV